MPERDGQQRERADAQLPAVAQQTGDQRGDADDRPHAAEQRLALLADGGIGLEHGDELDRGEVERGDRGDRLQREPVDAGHARGGQRGAGDAEQRQRGDGILEADHQRARGREDRERVHRRAAQESQRAGARERVAVAPGDLGERDRLGGPRERQRRPFEHDRAEVADQDERGGVESEARERVEPGGGDARGGEAAGGDERERGAGGEVWAAPDAAQRRLEDERLREREAEVAAEPGKRELAVDRPLRGAGDRGHRDRAPRPAGHQRQAVDDRGERDVGEHDPDPGRTEHERVRHPGEPEAGRRDREVGDRERRQPDVPGRVRQHRPRPPTRARAR